MEILKQRNFLILKRGMNFLILLVLVTILINLSACRRRLERIVPQAVAGKSTMRFLRPFARAIPVVEAFMESLRYMLMSKNSSGEGKNRVYRLMRANCTQSIRPRKYKATTNSRHNLPVAENLLNQNFHAEAETQY